MDTINDKWIYYNWIKYMDFTVEKFLVQTSRVNVLVESEGRVREVIESATPVNQIMSSDSEEFRSKSASDLDSDSSCEKARNMKIRKKQARNGEGIASKTSFDKKSRALQKFKPEWSGRFVWALKSQISEYHYHCKYCKVDRRCEQDGLGALKKHERGKIHKIAPASMLSSRYFFQMCQTHTDTKTRAKTVEVLATLFLIKKNLPVADMDDLIELLKTVDIDKSVQKQLACGRTKCTGIIKNVIGQHTLDQLVKMLQTCYFSLIIDESTDVAVKKQLVLCVRYFSPSEQKIHDQFLACLEVEDGTHKGQHKLIVDFFHRFKIPYRELMIGFAADGANVNFGQDHSISKLLQSEIPNLFVLKCVCHSLALGVSHAVKEIPREIEEFLSNTYRYLKYSSKRQLSLHSIQIELDLPEHKLLQYKKVRWLSLHSAVTRCLEQYDALYKFFEQESTLRNSHKDDEKSKRISAKTIFDRMKVLWTKLYLHFFDFILPIINEKNLLFQSEQPRIHQLHSKITLLFQTIARMYLKESYVDRVDIEDLDFSIGKGNEENIEPLRNLDLGPIVTTELMKLSAKFPITEIDRFRTNCRNFMYTFLGQLYERFPFKERSIKLIRELGFIEPANLADTKNIYYVADFLKLNSIAVHEEFRKLRNIFRFKCDSEISTFWTKVQAEVRADGSPEFPLVLDIVRRVMTLPHTSADVERIFSMINLNKTKQRNSMENDLLTGILHGKEFVKNKQLSKIEVTPLLRYMNQDIYNK